MSPTEVLFGLTYTDGLGNVRKVLAIDRFPGSKYACVTYEVIEARSGTPNKVGDVKTIGMPSFARWAEHEDRSSCL